MNNEAFRQLLTNGGAKPGSRGGQSENAAPPKTASLGSRRSAFMPLAPRNVRSSLSSNVFGKQSTPESDTQQKKSLSQKGLNLGKGYHDRAFERRMAGDQEEDEEGASTLEDRMRQMAALEKEWRSKTIDREEFERRKEILVRGGDGTIKAKGLDMALLEQDKLGEAGGEDPSGEVEADEELNDLEAKDVQQVEKEQRDKKGKVSEVLPIAGQKRTRDDILKELKAKRQADMEARASARPDLGDKFRSIETTGVKPRVVIDKKGREVIITKDEHGRIKKKVRKLEDATAQQPAAQPDKPLRYLDEGVIVPEKKSVPEPASDSEPEAMFEDAGDDYDPLAGLSGSDNDDDDDDDDKPEPAHTSAGEVTALSRDDTKTPEALQATIPSKPRNYFSTLTSNTTVEADDPSTTTAAKDSANPFKDPAFLSAISRASDLAKFRMHLGPSSADAAPQDGNGRADEAAEEEDEDSRIARLEKEARLRRKREEMLSASNRDLEDMDMGFGGDRFADDDDEDIGGKGKGKGKVRLSEWKGSGQGADQEGANGGAAKWKDKKKGKKTKGP